jgi:hypothetical protein
MAFGCSFVPFLLHEENVRNTLFLLFPAIISVPILHNVFSGNPSSNVNEPLPEEMDAKTSWKKDSLALCEKMGKALESIRGDVHSGSQKISSALRLIQEVQSLESPNSLVTPFSSQVDAVSLGYRLSSQSQSLRREGRRRSQRRCLMFYRHLILSSLEILIAETQQYIGVTFLFPSSEFSSSECFLFS